jgi:flavin reductase (DIM6/NTAB) family NADH-FMN oxidoreductase RutF
MLTGCCYVYQKQMLSRFLYPNPVCLLTLTHESVENTEQSFRNVMTVSWLTPVDNQGNILLSLNAKRFTADKMSTLPIGSPFVLNVPTSQQKNLILQIGKCSGRVVDKFENFGIARCFPGWQDTLPGNKSDNSGQDKGHGKPSKKQLQHEKCELLTSATCAISCCVAHLVCTLVKCTNTTTLGFADSDHIVVSANITCAYVRPDYWDGKTFASRHSYLPPILSFLGSGEFAHITKESTEDETDEKLLTDTCIDFVKKSDTDPFYNDSKEEGIS